MNNFSFSTHSTFWIFTNMTNNFMSSNRSISLFFWNKYIMWYTFIISNYKSKGAIILIRSNNIMIGTFQNTNDCTFWTIFIWVMLFNSNEHTVIIHRRI